VPAIAEVTFTSCDRVRDVLHNFNADGFDALYPATAVAARRRSRSRNVGGSRPGLDAWKCGQRPLLANMGSITYCRGDLA
jgi:hypothetical protein